MKPVKQKGQDYVDSNVRLEAVLEGIIYNPLNRKHYHRKHKNGGYLRFIKGINLMTKKKFGSIRDLKLHFTGVSHLDAAWLFPVIDTKERAYKTFYKAVEHCDLYPFLTFSQTTPQYYNWVKKYDKKLWEKVKQKVKDGRIELTGGMWVEPSLDMPSGESLVRQRLYGQLFFLREFGHFPKMESLLDIFGFPWSIPQILLKSGAESFWTTKDTGGLPFAAFSWKGIDGSEIFTFQHPYNWDVLTSTKEFRKKGRFPKPEYNHTELNSHMTRAEMEQRFSKEEGDYLRNLGVFYGLGDGGKGPLELEILYADALCKFQNGVHGSQHEFMDKLRAEVGDRYMIWNDEKYLFYHRGVKTTQVDVKHYNRLSEIWASAAETLITIMNIYYPGSVDYDKAYIFEMWRKILFNQFHDILPGSSIQDVYVLAIKEQKDSITMAKKIVNDCLNNIYGKLDKKTLELITENNDEKSFIMENKTIKVKINKKTGSITSIIQKEIGKDGKEFIETEGTYKNQGSGLRIFIEHPTQWKAWNLDYKYPKNKVNVKIKSKPVIRKNRAGVQFVSTTYQFLNSTAIVEFSLKPKDKMLRLWIHTDLKDGELLVKYFIPITMKSEDVTSDIPYGSIARKRIKRTHDEKGKWEMNMQKWVDISDGDCGLTVFNNNRYGFSATAKGLYLTITRTPEYPGVSPLYGSTRILPPNQRPKYTDMKLYTFKFGIYPHENTWKEANVIQMANNFNLPIITKIGKSKSESKSESINESINESKNKSDSTVKYELLEKPFLQMDNKNIIIGAIKPTEWSGDKLDLLTENKDWKLNKKVFIIRLIEQIGINIQTQLNFNPDLKIKSVEEVDILEMELKINSDNQQKNQFKIVNNSIKLEFGKFEIKTLKIEYIPPKIEQIQ